MNGINGGRETRGQGEGVVDLFTYDCVDGVARTRCWRHIARTGPYRMRGREPYHVRRGVSWWRCVECGYEDDQRKLKDR
jgi:hypothetical protein